MKPATEAFVSASEAELIDCFSRMPPDALFDDCVIAAIGATLISAGMDPETLDEVVAAAREFVSLDEAERVH